MNIDQDLEKIALQEKRLQFKHFDSEVAWVVGTALKAAAEKRQVAVAIDIQLHGRPLFLYAMPGTTPDNLDWIRRKRNVVLRYHRSSCAIGLEHERAQTTLQGTTGLDPKDYATHCGCSRFSLWEQGASARLPFPVCRSATTTRLSFPSFRITYIWRAKTWRSTGLRHLERKQHENALEFVCCPKVLPIVSFANPW